jgi:aconitate hydratase
MPQSNSFGAASTLTVGGSQYRYYALEALEKRGANIARIPNSIKVLLENLLRTEDDRTVKRSDIEYVAQWRKSAAAKEINFRPARVLLQDLTGVPCVVDMAAMRDALRDMGADPKRANPLIPADLVIDHSVQVDMFGSKDARLNSTCCSNFSVTRSATPFCAGAKKHSRIFAWCRRTRESAIR